MKPNKNKDHALERFWSRCALGHWTGIRWWIDDSYDIPNILVTIDQLVADIGRSKGDQFRLQKDRRGWAVVKSTDLARRILDCAKQLDLALVRRHLNCHSFSPHYELWEACRDHFDLLSFGEPSTAWVLQVNQWIDSVRAKARAPSLVRALENRVGAASKKKERVGRYVNALLRRYANLQVVQLDLGYRNDPFDDGTYLNRFSDDQVAEHLKKVRSFIRKGLKGFVGSIWRLESSSIKGHSCHLMLFFDGCLGLDGSTCALPVASEWSAITQGYGTYWNWSAEHISRQCHVIGTISVFDDEGRRRLVQEAMFLAQLDYYARFESPAFKRTFGKAEISANLVRRTLPHERGRFRITAKMAAKV